MQNPQQLNGFLFLKNNNFAEIQQVLDDKDSANTERGQQSSIGIIFESERYTNSTKHCGEEVVVVLKQFYAKAS